MEMKFNGLKRILSRFVENDWKGAYSSGLWKIANGGYDCWFQIYYNEQYVAECVDGEVSVNGTDYYYLKLQQIIVDQMPDLKKTNFKQTLLAKPNQLFAIFTSVWDDGETTVVSECVVDPSTKRIITIDTANREVYSSNEEINVDNVDDVVESLDKEYVEIETKRKNGSTTKQYLAFGEDDADKEIDDEVYLY